MPTGIYRDRYGFRAVVDIAAGRKEKRFDPDTELAVMKRWRNETKVKLERLHPQKRAGAVSRGTFSAAVRQYLRTLAISSWRSRRSELRAWEHVFGTVKQARINSEHVKKAIKQWSDAGVAPKTILNRVRAFTAMYHALDGKDAWTPADGVARPPLAKRNPDYVTPDQIRAVERRLAEMELDGLDQRWRGRFMVLASTGARPAFLMRAVANDVLLERGEWRIDAAKGGNPIILPLNEDMIAAWERFLETNAWGPYDQSDLAERLRAAGWPAHIRPYAMKHSVSQDLADRGVDLETIADWHGHTGGFRTTRIYTGFRTAKLRIASQALEGRLGWESTARKNLSSILGAPAPTTPKDQQIRDLLRQLEALTHATS